MKRILIIEDEKSIAELEKDYLEIEGFAVDIELSGSNGVLRLAQEQYDLLILDIMLPGIDGFEICRLVRAERDIPIIMISAKKEDLDKVNALGLGADDYITKPFSPSELVARVKAHISRYQRLSGIKGSRNDEIRIGGLNIDKTSRRVFVNGREVILTVKEFELLLFLATNPNKVFSKKELFETIWYSDSIGDIGTVSVHIRRIREKIETDSSSPQYIETLWGAGYRFRG